MKNSFTSSAFNNYYTKTNCDRLWRILNNETYTEIKANDVVKLGRVRLKFDKISIGDKTNNTFQNIINMNYTSFHPFTTDNNNNNSNSNSPIMITNNNNYALHNIMSVSSNSKSLSNNNNNNNHKVTTINISCNNELQTSTITTNTNYIMNQNINNIINSVFIPQLPKEQRTCRICYSNQSDLSDPLISPCNCTGSMSYIHFKCLKRCILSKLHKKEDICYISYIIKNQQCEICLKTYPKRIQYKNVCYDLIDFDYDKYDNYALCDYSIYEDNKKQLTHKGYLLINLDEADEITIGRNQSNNVKLKDISVSRTHCVMMLVEGKLMMKDQKSKFGSLMYIKDNERVGLSKQFDGVSGKHLFTFSVSEKWSLFDSIFRFGCCSCKNTNDDESVNLEREVQIIRKLPNKQHQREDNVGCCCIMESKVYVNKEVNDSYEDYVLNLSRIYLDNENDDNDVAGVEVNSPLNNIIILNIVIII